MDSLPSAAFSLAGRRPYQHDRYSIATVGGTQILTVADGHGCSNYGHLVSDHCASELAPALHSAGALSSTGAEAFRRIRDVVEQLEESSIALTHQQRVFAGSTLCSVMRHNNSLTCINVGDSRAILVSVHPTYNTLNIRALTRDHICSDAEEEARIKRAGGVVVGNLLNGYISMTRAIGDNDLKAYRNSTPFPVKGSASYSGDLFIAEPDISDYAVSQGDLMLIIASDGVWSTLSNWNVGKLALASASKNGNAEAIARSIVHRALSKGSTDNVTALVSMLRPTSEVHKIAMQTQQKFIGFSQVRKRRSRKPSHSGSATPVATSDFEPDVSADADSCETIEVLDQPQRRARSAVADNPRSFAKRFSHRGLVRNARSHAEGVSNVSFPVMWAKRGLSALSSPSGNG